jgi:concentrative nucleoside transporter, CNT family
MGELGSTIQATLGLFVLVGVAWIFSENRKIFGWKRFLIAIGCQFFVALLLIHVSVVQELLLGMNNVVSALQNATKQGTSMVFGYVGGGSLPFQENFPGASFVLAFQALPLVLLISALSALLWHWRILPAIIFGFSALFKKLFNLRGSVSVVAAANIFVGMIEAPILVRPLFEKLSRSDLFLIMTCGMATIAGTVMVLYSTFIANVIDGSLGHLITASVVSIPASILIARTLVPREEAERGQDDDDNVMSMKSPYRSSMEAITTGTQNGFSLLLTIIAMLIVMVALVAVANSLLSFFPSFGGTELSVQRIFSWAFTPVVWLLGIPSAEIGVAAELMGIKTVLNELLAYLKMSQLPEGALSDHSRLIMIYAMSGFANFGSLGIMLGGMLSIAPNRRNDLIGLGLKSILSGTLASCMTGAVIGIVA